MQCRQCGKPLREGEDLCPSCGADQELMRSVRPSPRVPVAAYAPTPQGPPAARDVGGLPAALPAQLAPTDETAPIRRLGYQPVVLPPPPASRSRPLARRFGRSVLAVLALFAVLGLAAGLVARVGNVPIPGLAVAESRPTATATPATLCKPAPLAQVTPAPLGPPQLTTSLKNQAQHDYRPVNTVTRFSPGVHAYVTFQVLSSQAGTADVLVCTPGRLLSGPVPVPAGSSGLYVEFPLSFDSADVGQGMVTISWDGSVIGNAGFTVVRCPSPVAGQRACG